MEKTKLTDEDRERYNTIRACIDSDLTNAEAGARLRLSIRQVRRLKRAVELRGPEGVTHALRDRGSNNATDPKIIAAAVVFLKQEKNHDFGPTFAMEQLAKQKDIVLSRETVRTIMVGNDLRKSKTRNGPRVHRAWRERRAMYGEMIQFDGSYHDWLENGEEQCLLGAVDDATGTIMRAVFDDNEGVAAVFRFWWAYIEAHGRPVAIYLDKFSTYKVNHKNAVDNEELITQFQRAMGELDVRVICANSPEGKGRIERLFGTLQDRLVKEMRLEDIKDRETANQFLEEVYLPDHNKRFFASPRQEGDAHRPLSQEMRRKLPSIFSIQSKRTVTNDFTFRFKNQWYQLLPQQSIAVYRGDTVLIEEWLDGTVHIRLKDTYLSFVPIGKLERAARPRVTALTREKPRWKPPVDHPWRRTASRAVEIKKLKKSRNAR